MRSLVIFLLLCLLSVAQVTALALSPPDVRMDYEPGKTYQFSVAVTNLNDFPIGLETRTTGALSEGGVVSAQLPVSIPAHQVAEIPITVTLPMTRERPGHQTSYIFFKERFSDKLQGFFSVRTEVGLTVDVWQPFPGSYAEITASAQSVSRGEDTLLHVSVNNLGVEPIKDGSAIVRVVSATGEQKAVFSYTGINVSGNSNTGFMDVIESGTYEPGKYILEATLHYGENASHMNGSFIVGKQEVNAEGVEGKFYLDQPVNKFEIPIESLWNLPLDNVYAVFTLGAHTTQTAALGLEPFGRNTLSGYWETDALLAPGNQTASVQLFFPGGDKTYTFPVTVYNETPRVAPVELEEPSITLGSADIIFIVLVVIIVICIVVFAVQRHTKTPPQLPPTQLPTQPPAPPAQPKP